MLTDETPARKTDAGPTDDEPSERLQYLANIAGVFGVDATGAKHRYSRARDTIYVTRDGELEQVEELHGRDVDDWISYVRFKRGWVDEWFHETLGPIEGAQRLTDAVNAAAESDEGSDR